jgi:hypothetical protein
VATYNRNGARVFLVPAAYEVALSAGNATAGRGGARPEPPTSSNSGARAGFGGPGNKAVDSSGGGSRRRRGAARVSFGAAAP